MHFLGGLQHKIDALNFFPCCSKASQKGSSAPGQQAILDFEKNVHLLPLAIEWVLLLWIRIGTTEGQLNVECWIQLILYGRRSRSETPLDTIHCVVDSGGQFSTDTWRCHDLLSILAKRDLNWVKGNGRISLTGVRVMLLCRSTCYGISKICVPWERL